MKWHNFVYKPLNLEIDWYKYPLRDSYTNQKIAKEVMLDMFKNLYRHFEIDIKRFEHNVQLYLK